MPFTHPNINLLAHLGHWCQCRSLPFWPTNTNPPLACPDKLQLDLIPFPCPSLSLSLCFFVLFWLVKLASSFLVLSYLMKWIFYYVCVYIMIWIWVLILNFLDLCSCFWSCAYVEIWVCVLEFVLLCFWSCADVQIWAVFLSLYFCVWVYSLNGFGLILLKEMRFYGFMFLYFGACCVCILCCVLVFNFFWGFVLSCILFYFCFVFYFNYVLYFLI